MQRFVLVLAVTALTGCSASGINTGGAKKNVARESIAINCGGFLGWEACNAKAAKMCPKGYEMIRKDEDAVSQRRIMFITCN